MIKYHYPLFGGAANSGPASSIIYWQQIQDPGSDKWSETVENALLDVMMSDDENLSNAISDAMISLQSIPSTEYPDSTDLKNWSVTNPKDWQSRMDSGENNARIKL